MALPHVAVGDPLPTALNAERDAINQNSTDILKKIDKPTLPQRGDVLVYDGTKWGALNIGYFNGSGSPEGTVAAPVGSRYTDIAAATGAVEYVKQSGTGNTGWLLVGGYTGLRNISTLVDKRNNGVVNAAHLSRANNVVECYFDLKMPTQITSPYTLLTLPVGFRPPFDRYGGLQDNNESAAASTLVSAGGVCQLFTIVSAKSDRWQGTWITRDPWPTALPGAAA